MKADVRDPYYK